MFEWSGEKKCKEPGGWFCWKVETNLNIKYKNVFMSDIPYGKGANTRICIDVKMRIKVTNWVKYPNRYSNFVKCENRQHWEINKMWNNRIVLK